MHETFRSNEWMYVTKNICCCRYNICPLCFFPDGCCHGGRRWAVKRKGGAFNRGTDKGEQQAFAWQAKERACPSFHTCTDHWNKKRPDSNRRGRQYKEFCSCCVLVQGVYINKYIIQQDQKKDIPWIESTMQSFDEPNAPNASTRHSTISDLVVDGRRMMKDEKMLFTRVSYTGI